LLGDIFWHFRFRRKVILKNLNIAFPDKDLKWKKSIGKKCFQSIGSVLFEFFRLPSYFSTGKLNKILVIDKGKELLEKYRDTGAVLVSCHLGNWEIAGAMISAMGHKLSVLAYRQKNNTVHKLMHRISILRSSVRLSQGLYATAFRHLEAERIYRISCRSEYDGRAGYLCGFLWQTGHCRGPAGKISCQNAKTNSVFLRVL